MAERPNTVAGLIEKRRETTGQIEHHQRILNELIIDLDHLDHTLRLFDPDCDVALAQPKAFPARHAAFRGEMQRFVLGALRAAQEPVTSLEIAIEVVKGRGLDPNDSRAVSLIRKRVGACLFHLKAKGAGAGCADRRAVQGVGGGGVMERDKPYCPKGAAWLLWRVFNRSRGPCPSARSFGGKGRANEMGRCRFFRALGSLC